MRKPVGSKVYYYRDRRKEWRWRLVARNGRIVACSSEGYKNRCDAKRNFYRIWRTFMWVVEQC